MTAPQRDRRAEIQRIVDEAYDRKWAEADRHRRRGLADWPYVGCACGWRPARTSRNVMVSLGVHIHMASRKAEKTCRDEIKRLLEETARLNGPRTWGRTTPPGTPVTVRRRPQIGPPMIEYTAVPLEWRRMHPGKYQADGERHRYVVQRIADGWELVVYRLERSGVRYVERGAGDGREMCMDCAELYEGAKRAPRAARR